jgi:hypothetical protein
MNLADEGRSSKAVWIATILVTLVFAGFLAVAIVEEPFAALYGIAGLLVGALIAGSIALTRRRSESGQSRQDRMLELFAERIESLEAERGRVMELEERIDFAERLLAKERPARRLEGSSA